MLTLRFSEISIVAPPKVDSYHGNMEPYPVPKESLQDSVVALATGASRPSTAGSLNANSIPSRRSSLTSYNTLFGDYAEVPKLVRTPWEADRSKRSNIAKRTTTTTTLATRPLPAHIFKDLPEEIYDCILQQLEHSHFDRETGGACTTCYMKDLHNVALTSRTWERSARRQLYSKIWISSMEPTNQKQTRSLPDNRIKLLRRTLREGTRIARLVKELHFPDAHDIYQSATTKERQHIINSLASLVMSSPNLERFSGLYLTYDHGFDRLTHAISTRTCLKDKVWVLKADDVGWDDSGNYRTNSRIHDPYWNADNPDAFLHSHDNWSCLDTLCLFGQGNCSMMDYRAFVATFRTLPSLKHLLISDFETDQFNDRTLQALPALRSLRLQDLPGVTDRGLMRFANSETAKSIRRLSLINLEIASAAVLSRFFSNLPRLRRFVLAQDACPSLAPGLDISGTLYSSKTLESIHWEVLAYGPAHQDLAASIIAGGLPSLRTIRAPSDDDGFLQALCRPKEQIMSDNDKHLVSQINNPFAYSCLSTSRREAQQRLEDARKEPYMKIVVDDDGVIRHTYTVYHFMGVLESKIEYKLEPDIEGSEEPIAGLNDLLIRRETRGVDNECFGGTVGPESVKRQRFNRRHIQRKVVKSPRLGVFF